MTILYQFHFIHKSIHKDICWWCCHSYKVISETYLQAIVACRNSGACMYCTWWQSQNYSHYSHYHYPSSLLDVYQSNNIISHLFPCYFFSTILSITGKAPDIHPPSRTTVRESGRLTSNDVNHSPDFVTELLVFWMVQYFSIYPSTGSYVFKVPGTIDILRSTH